jgi:uncharacterized phage-associated protein
MKIPIQKLKAMILYFATFTDSRLLGKVKLMKLFYFTDFGHVKKYASPITFDNYVHLEHGPIPSAILNLVDAVETDINDSILGDVLSIESKEGSNMKRIVASRRFVEKDKEFFAPNELAVMEEICSRFKDTTGKNIEDISHQETAWKTTKTLENIPYTLAIGDPDCLVDEEDIKTVLSISA